MAIQRTVSDLYNSYFDSNISVEVGKEDDGTSVSGAMRFTNITLNQGQSIQNATLGFYVGLKGTGTGDLKAIIYGIDEDNTGSFSGSPLGRTRTTAFDQANWSLPPQGEFSNHDVTSIVQEIVNRSGWSSGNAIGFHILDNGSPDRKWVYDSGLSKLTITLSSPSPSPSPSPSRSVSKSPSPTPSASISPSPSLSPEVPASNYGLKISKEGYDVKTSGVLQDIFTSGKGILGKRKTDTCTVITDLGYIDDGKAHGLPYIPLALVTVTTRDGTVINVPGSRQSEWNANETLYEFFDYRLTETFIMFTVQAYHQEDVQGGSTTQLDNQSYTFKILYCFNELSIEE